MRKILLLGVILPLFGCSDPNDAAALRAWGAAMSGAASGYEAATPAPVSYGQPSTGQVCMKANEAPSGMNKICYYSCTGSGAAITIAATSLCPLTIQR